MTRFRTLIVGLGVTALVLVPASMASAETPDVTIGSCTFVGSPTPDHHTSCEGDDLSGADVAGINLDYADLASADLSQSSIVSSSTSAHQVNLNGADLTGADLSGADLTGSTARGTTFTGATLNGANFANVDVSSTSFGAGVSAENVDWRGAQLNGSTLPTDLAGSDLEGDNLSVLAGVAAGTSFAGANLRSANLQGLNLPDFSAPNADLEGAEFNGVTFPINASFSAPGANFTSASFRGVDFSPVIHTNLAGAIFAYADLSFAKVPIASNGYYADADFENSYLMGAGDGAVFHRANLTNATFRYGPTGSGTLVDLDGAQFNGAELAGANLNNTTLNGAVFNKSDLSGAHIQSGTLHGMDGLIVVDSNLTNSSWPPAANGPDATGKWLKNIYLQNDALGGSSFATGNVYEQAQAGATSSTADIELPNAFFNYDDEIPADPGYDAAYWSGARDTCNHNASYQFPLGTSTVSCDVTFDNGNGGATAATPYNITTAVDPASVADPTAAGVVLAGLAAPAHSPVPSDATASDLAGFDISQYRYGSLLFPTHNGIRTTSTYTFTVNVVAPPTISGTAHNGVAGQPYKAVQLHMTGFPTPTVAITNGQLPNGLQLSPTGELSGTPAADSAGEYTVTVHADNGVGGIVNNSHTTGVRTASTSSSTGNLQLTFWIVDPAAQVPTSKPLSTTSQVPVVGAKFTPGGDVKVWLEPENTLVATVTASSTGTVKTDVPAPAVGTHSFHLVDVASSSTANTGNFEVVGDPAGILAYTGITPQNLPFLAVALLILGAIALLVTTLIHRRRHDASTGA